MGYNKQKLIIGALILVVLILGGVVGYTYAAKPFVTGYVVNAQNQGIEFAVVSIMQQAANCQLVPLTFGDQTINLIAVECLQQQSPEVSTPEEVIE